MRIEDFKQQMKLYKQARESNPSLSYWQWKINRYSEGTDEITNTELPEVIVTPDRNYVNYPIDWDAYNSAKLDAWGKTSQLEILGEALRPAAALDPIQHIGAARNAYYHGKSYWGSLAGTERNLGIVPEAWDVNPLTTEAMNFAAGLVSPGAVVFGINKINKANRLARNIVNTKRNSNFINVFNSKNYTLEEKIANRQKFLKRAKRQGFDVVNSVIDPENAVTYKNEFYNPENEVAIMPLQNSEAYKYTQDFKNTFGLKNNSDIKDFIFASNEYDYRGWYNRDTKLPYINPDRAEDINSTFIHEALSHGTDNAVENIKAFPDLDLTVADLYKPIANITNVEGSNNWYEVRATLNQLRNLLIREGRVKNIEDIKNMPDELLNDFIERNLQDINKYGEDYIEALNEVSEQVKMDWLRKVRLALRYLPATLPFVIDNKDENQIPKYSDGTDKITEDNRNRYKPGSSSYARMSGTITPVFNIQDAADFTPVGDVLAARDTYNAFRDQDYITASAMLGLMLAPPALGKIAKETIPSFVTAAADKINELRRKERRNKELDTKIFSQGIEDRNRIIEELYDTPGIWDRAYNTDITYGTNYVDTYNDLINNYYSNYFNLPEPRRTNIGDAKAKMTATQAAIDRYNLDGTPASWDDFEYLISPDIEQLDKALIITLILTCLEVVILMLVI